MKQSMLVSKQEQRKKREKPKSWQRSKLLKLRNLQSLRLRLKQRKRQNELLRLRLKKTLNCRLRLKPESKKELLRSRQLSKLS